MDIVNELDALHARSEESNHCELIDSATAAKHFRAFWDRVDELWPLLSKRLRAAEAVCEAAAADLKTDRDNNERLFGMSASDWMASLGSGEKATLHALGAWRIAKETT